MRIEILDGETVVNTINATEEFAQQTYPGAWRIAAVQDAAPAKPAQSCSPAQGLVALFALKQITESDISAGISSITNPVERYTTQIAFARATEWQRNSPSMAKLAGMLGLTSEDMDDLFAYASGVAV